MSLILVGGGARSGKSAFALERALGCQGRRVFVATAEIQDDEMRARVNAHRDERIGEDGTALFETFEEPLNLAGLLKRLVQEEGLQAGDTVVVDCLTLWLSNVLLKDESLIEGAIADLAEVAFEVPFELIMVTNEVGMGLVPPNKLGRLFRDAAGRLHQILGTRADELYLAALGRMLRLVPGPVEVV